MSSCIINFIYKSVLVNLTAVLWFISLHSAILLRFSYLQIDIDGKNCTFGSTLLQQKIPNSLKIIETIIRALHIKFYCQINIINLNKQTFSTPTINVTNIISIK